jgi:hypothetical protein
MYLMLRESGVRFLAGGVTRFPVIRNEKTTPSQFFQRPDASDAEPRWIGFQTVGPTAVLQVAW